MHDSDTNVEQTSMSSMVVNKFVHNQSKVRQPKARKHTLPDEYLEYLNINNYSNSQDNDGRTRSTYTEHREYIKITHSSDQRKSTMQTALGKSSTQNQLNVPTGSKIFGGFIIPPFFSRHLNKNASKPNNDPSQNTGTFLGNLLSKITSPRKVEEECEMDDVIGQPQSIWEERQKAKAFLDSYLVDCMSKESSVFTPDEKLQMKTIQDILANEKKQEIARGRKGEDGERGKSERGRKKTGKGGVGKKETKKGAVRTGKNRYENQGCGDEEYDKHLVTDLSEDHPLFARKFREKVRIYTKSGKEVSVNKNGVSLVGDSSTNILSSCMDESNGNIDLVRAIRHENERTRQFLRRVHSSEAESYPSTLKHDRPRRHEIDLAGDVEVEFSHKVMEENHKILHKLQIDQAREIELNKIIIEENKRTLKKLKMEQVKEKLRQSVKNENLEIKKTDSGRFRKERVASLTGKPKDEGNGTSVLSNSNVVEESVDNEITSGSQENVIKQTKKKAWSTEMLSKKQKAERMHKHLNKTSNLESVRKCSNGHANKNAEVSTRRKQTKTNAEKMPQIQNSESELEEDCKSNSAKASLPSKRFCERKLDMKKYMKENRFRRRFIEVRKKRQDSNESRNYEYRRERNHIEPSLQQCSEPDSNTDQDFSIDEHQRSKLDKRTKITQYGPSTTEPMFQGQKEIVVARSSVPMKLKKLYDGSSHDKRRGAELHNSETADVGNIKTNATSNGKETLMKHIENHCGDSNNLKDDAAKQHKNVVRTKHTKTSYTTEEEGEYSNYQNRNNTIKQRKKCANKRHKDSGLSVTNTTSKESLAESIQLRDVALKERRKYISNRRKRTDVCDKRKPCEAQNNKHSIIKSQETFQQRYQDVKSKIGELEKVLEEGEKVKGDMCEITSDNSTVEMLQRISTDEISGKQLGNPLKKAIKLYSDKDSSKKGSRCMPRNKRAGLVVSKRKLGPISRRKHKDNHERNKGRNNKSVALSRDTSITANLLKTENCRRKTLKEEIRNKGKGSMLVEGNKQDTKYKLNEMLKRVHEKTQKFSLLSRYINQVAFDCDRSEDESIPGVRLAIANAVNDKIINTKQIENSKESTFRDYPKSAKHKRPSSKSSEKRTRSVDPETELIDKKDSSKERMTKHKESIVFHDKEELCKVNQAIPKETLDKQDEKTEADSNRVHGGNVSHRKGHRAGRHSHRHRRTAPSGKHKNGTNDIDSLHPKQQTEEDGVRNQHGLEGDNVTGKPIKQDTSSKPLNISKSNNIGNMEEINGDSGIICRENETKEVGRGDSSNALQRYAGELQKKSTECLNQSSSLSINVRSKQMIDHMAQVLSDYLAKKQQARLEEVQEENMKNEGREADELREAVESVRRQIQAEKQTRCWQVADATTENGVEKQLCAKRDPSRQTGCCSHDIIYKHIEECVEDIEYYLSACDEQNELFEEGANVADVKQRGGDINAENEKCEGIYQVDTMRNTCGILDSKTMNVITLGPMENDENIISFSHKHARGIELKNDELKISTCYEAKQEDSQTGPLSKNHAGSEEMVMKRDNKVDVFKQVTSPANVKGGGADVKKLSLKESRRTKKHLNGSSNVGLGDTNQKTMENISDSGLLKQDEGSDYNWCFDNNTAHESKIQLDPKGSSHISQQKLAGDNNKCTACKTPVKPQSVAISKPYDDEASPPNESLSTNELLIEKPIIPKLERMEQSGTEIFRNGQDEFQHEAEHVDEISIKDYSITDYQKEITSVDDDSRLVMSCIDTPDKAIQEIFKKMDDVIINRFLTLASSNGITIVVTPKLVVNETTQSSNEAKDNDVEETAEEVQQGEFDEKNFLKEKTNLETSAKEILKFDEGYDADKQVNDDKNMLPNKLLTNKPKIVIGDQPECTILGDITSDVIDTGIKDNNDTIISHQEHDAKALGVTHEPDTSALHEFQKCDAYFISQTISQSADAIRKEKKIQVRLHRTRTTKTRPKVGRASKARMRRKSEPERVAQRAVERKQVVDHSTSLDFSHLAVESCITTNKLRLLEEIAFIDIPDTGKTWKEESNYDRCFEQVLHCLPAEIQVNANGLDEEVANDSSGILPDGESFKQNEVPVDYFLEKVRSNLDMDELKMLEETSKTTINILAERRSYDPEDLNMIFCKYNYNNGSSSSCVVPNIKTIEEIIAEADSSDNLVSICDCFGVDTIDDLMDQLKSNDSDNIAVVPMDSRHTKKKSDKTISRKHRHREMERERKTNRNNVQVESRHKEINGNRFEMVIEPYKCNSEEIEVCRGAWNESTTNSSLLSLDTSFETNELWKYCKRPKVEDITQWMLNGELAARDVARENETGVIPYKTKKKKTRKEESNTNCLVDANKDSNDPLSNFILNYALKSGIILTDATPAQGKEITPLGESHSDDILNVKIELNDDGYKKTQIVIQVPENQDFKLGNKRYKRSALAPLHSTAQIVHVDSEEIVLSTDSPEVPEWTRTQQEAFEKALKKHPPTPNVWDQIARSVGRSKRDCVLHFMGIWRRIENASE